MSYYFHGSQAEHSHSYLESPVINALSDIPPPARLFDLGCGNGAFTNKLGLLGYEVVGVDPSEIGMAHAVPANDKVKFSFGSAYDDLATVHGVFDAVVSLEVVEHLYSPAKYVETIRSLLKPGGMAVISTPYHGYLKNLALAVAGNWDAHHGSLWEGGHIKFWSPESLRKLFEMAGMRQTSLVRVGRMPALAKSMVATFRL